MFRCRWACVGSYRCCYVLCFHARMQSFGERAIVRGYGSYIVMVKKGWVWCHAVAAAPFAIMCIAGLWLNVCTRLLKCSAASVWVVACIVWRCRTKDQSDLCCVRNVSHLASSIVFVRAVCLLLSCLAGRRIRTARRMSGGFLVLRGCSRFTRPSFLMW